MQIQVSVEPFFRVVVDVEGAPNEEQCILAGRKCGRRLGEAILQDGGIWQASNPNWAWSLGPAIEAAAVVLLSAGVTEDAATAFVREATETACSFESKVRAARCVLAQPLDSRDRWRAGPSDTRIPQSHADLVPHLHV